MKLYHLKRTNDYGYDEYTDFVVCAPDMPTAIKMQPREFFDDEDIPENGVVYGWVDVKDIEITFLGTASGRLEQGVICVSLHAG